MENNLEKIGIICNLIAGCSSSRTLHISFSVSVTGETMELILWKNFICSSFIELTVIHEKRVLWLLK